MLQPHFVSVWESQAHNLAYNVSAEFDDYRERDAWVKKGIDFLVRGTQFNRRQPLLQWHLGKYTTMKLGRSDEKLQFRELFRNDEAYHKTLMEYGLDIEQPDTRGSDRKPDNWLVGRLWFLQAYDLVRAGFYCKKSPLLFFAESPWALFYYAEAIEEEGVLDDKAMFAWSRASDAWAEYGNLDLMTTWGHTIQMRGLAAANEAVEKSAARFNELTRSVRQELIEQAKDQFTPDEWTSLTKPEAERSPEEADLANFAFNKVALPPLVLAQRLPREQRSEGIQLANELADHVEFARHIDRSRELVNYLYWETRGELEQTPTATAARRQIYEAEEYLTEADLNKANELYEVGWKNWDRVLRRYPMMLHEESADALLRSIDRYAKDRDIIIEEGFPLYWFYRYRAIRDKNKAGEETISMYQEFVDAAAKNNDNLETPFELGGVEEPVDNPETRPEKPRDSRPVKPLAPDRAVETPDKLAIPLRPPTLVAPE